MRTSSTRVGSLGRAGILVALLLGAVACTSSDASPDSASSPTTASTTTTTTTTATTVAVVPATDPTGTVSHGTLRFAGREAAERAEREEATRRALTARTQASLAGLAQATMPTSSGSGLGLAISKLAIDQMDGQLALRSQPDHGSIFTIALHTAELALEHPHA